MIGRTEKLGITLLLSIALANFSGSEVFASNTLSQVDVRKNSSDSLEFTLYTSSPYADNVVVTKKSDNKYVILMPNINGTTSSKPDFSGVKDIVTDIDVRAVDDGGSGYTKVTVITNRPVDIKTNTAKNVAPTQGQKEYRALIAQQQTKASTTKPATQSSTAFKLPEIQPTQTAATTVATAQKPTTTAKATQNVAQKTTSSNTTTKQTATKPATNTTKKAETKPAVNKTTETKVAQAKPTATPTQTVANKTVEQPKAEQKPVEQTTTAETKSAQENTTSQNQITEVATATGVATTAVTSEIAELQPTASTVDFQVMLANIKSKLAGKIPEGMPVTLMLILVPLACLMILFNLIKGSLQRSQMLKKMMMENMARRHDDTSSYNEIINDETLNWQERYQQYREIAKETEEMDDTAKYSFIAQPRDIRASFEEQDVPQQPKNNELYTKGVIHPKKTKQQNIENLEKILHVSPSVEKTELAEDIDNYETEEFLMPNVASEDESIHKEITKTIKLKAFAEKMILEESHRNKKVKHRRVQLELPKEEAPHVNLGYSKLHSNPRSLQGANLSVSDLIAKSNKLLNIKPELPIEAETKTDYETVTVNEYLNLLEDDIAKVTSPLSEVVANKLSKIKEKREVAKPVETTATNPITSLRNKTSEDYLSGLIVKSGFNIDDERGFYLVSLDGKSAVIGRVGEEVYVLKKFDKNIDKPLQVRKDNPNVYMVKADDFKSLVEVGKDNMGVLIEL